MVNLNKTKLHLTAEYLFVLDFSFLGQNYGIILLLFTKKGIVL